jgi:hypothetical protein
MSLTRTATAFGAFYRRLAARVAKPVAITATARKLAVIVYRVLSSNLVYNDPGPPLTTSSIALESSSHCVNAHDYSASTSLTKQPARSLPNLFPRRHASPASNAEDSKLRPYWLFT